MTKKKLLIIDDEKHHAEATAESLEKVGYRCFTAFTGREGLRIFEGEGIDLVITDLRMRDVDGMVILRTIKRKNPAAEVIVVTGYGSAETAVEAMQAGAANYLMKPINVDELRTVVEKAIEQQRLARDNVELHRALDKKFSFEGILGNSTGMLRIFDTMNQIASTNATVLILGESGTGKELIAHAIHNNSLRKNHRMVPLNCASLSESLLESELFGHEKGAFTGATTTREGRFEYANGGTLFLDEVGDISLNTQTKLLRTLENREVFRIGSNKPVPIDVRLISATHRDLEEMVAAGDFRDDLYFRLKVVTIKIPPLRERRDDIPLMIEAFASTLAQEHGAQINEIPRDARDALCAFDWPGNVRQLRNAIESMVVLSRDGVLSADLLPEEIRSGSTGGPRALDLEGYTLEELEKLAIENALRRFNGNRAKSARYLDISDRTFYRKLDKYGLK